MKRLIKVSLTSFVEQLFLDCKQKISDLYAGKMLGYFLIITIPHQPSVPSLQEYSNQIS